MDSEALRSERRRDFTSRRRWAVLVNLAAITLLLVTYVAHTSQAAIPIEQAECDAGGRPGFGILPQDVGAVDIYSNNILSLAGCMSNGDAATLPGTPASVHDHGHTKPRTRR